MRLRTREPEETGRVGYRLGRVLRAGDTVCLYGDLGAGKTTFVKGLAGALGISGRDVTSASYTMVVQYDTHPPLYHIDLYRLEGPGQIEAAGIYDYIGGDGIAVIEWAEKIPPEDAADAVKVRIAILKGDEREITIEGMELDEEDRDTM